MFYKGMRERPMRGLRTGLWRGASLAAISIAMVSTSVYAQDVEDEDDSNAEVITVRGIRSSLQSAQEIRRNSDVLVDAITAEDIGALPDRSVAEALQRVPGVNITRFEGENDPDHFSVEGSGAIIRGLNFARSELNGRDVFSADNGQQIGFNDVSPEMLGSVEVFKNQSADMIEGGLAGTVNLNTRLPFDQGGRMMAFTLEANYSDFAEEVTPTMSGIYSNRWELGNGSEFGLIFGASYSELQSRADGTLVAEWLDRDPSDGQSLYVPSGAGIRTQLFHRTRDSISAAAQWRSADGELEATAQFFRASYENAWSERAVEPSIDSGPAITPAPGTSFTYDDNGLFESGVISENVGWRSNDPTHPLNGVRQLALARGKTDESLTTDIGFNLRWSPTDRFRASFDLQFVESEVNIADVTVHGAFFSDIDLDVTGDVPSVIYRRPADGSDPYFSDASNYYLRSAMDHLSDNEGESVAFRADAEYDFEGDSWLRSVRFGGRVSNREQVVRSSVYNWGNISATWNSPFALDNPAIPPGTFELYNFDNYMRGMTTGLEGGIPMYTGALGEDYDQAVAAIMAMRNAAGNGGWVPLAQRGGVVAGTPFLPSEITDVTQDTTAFYGRLDFDNEHRSDGIRISGNVGLRYVETQTSAVGALSFPDRALVFNGMTPAAYCAGIVGTTPGICLEDAATQTAFYDWADGSNQSNTDSHTYENWLPSANVVFGITDEFQIRLGLSQAIFRPDFGLMKSNLVIQQGGDDPVTGAWLGPDASTGNVQLDPITADKFDHAFEWYFDDVGSLTFSLFQKNLSDYIVPAILQRDVTNNGETFAVDVDGVGNASDSGEIKGFEVAYQQTFDDLPGMWSGLGVQANYTYIDAQGVPNIGPKNDEPNGRGSAPNFDVSQLRLPLMSEHTVNLVGFYETDSWSARLAYNWRSEYTLTVRDVIYPFTPVVHESTGQLDGSIFYDITDSLTVGVQAVNLLDEVSETSAVINSNLVQAPRAYFRNDRRFAFVLRGRF